MIRCLKTKFKTTSEGLDRLFECNRQSALVWNEVLRLAREYSLANGGKWIGKSELQAATKKRFPLHSQSVQAVCHKYLFSRDAARAARKLGLRNKYPYKTKKNFPTKWAKDGFKVLGPKAVQLSLGIQGGKRAKPITIKTSADIPLGIREIELVWGSGLVMSISYDDGTQAPEMKEDGETVAIDPGEIHSIAAVSTAGEALVISGRKIRSIHRLRNKKVAELTKLMSRCKKGSRQWKRYRKAKAYVLSKSDAQLRDANHKNTRAFVDFCVSAGVRHVVTGNPEGVQRRKKGKRSKNANQKISNWSFGKVNEYLAYKLEAEGIGFSKREESYTSQTCPVCGRRKKPSGRLYRCGCGYSQHRDVHGALNILSKHMHGGEIVDTGIRVGKVTYLRPA